MKAEGQDEHGIQKQAGVNPPSVSGILPGGDIRFPSRCGGRSRFPALPEVSSRNLIHPVSNDNRYIFTAPRGKHCHAMT